MFKKNEKITKKKELNQYYSEENVDFFSAKDPIKTASEEIMSQYIEGPAVLFLDSSFFYQNEKESMKNELFQLKEKLQTDHIELYEKTTKTDLDLRIMGIPMNLGKGKKETNSLLVFYLRPEEFQRYSEQLMRLNFFVFFMKQQLSFDELFPILSDAINAKTIEEYESFKDLVQKRIFYDPMFLRCQILSKRD